MVLFGGFGEPFGSVTLFVAGDAVVVEDAEGGLGIGVILGGRFGEPCARGGVVAAQGVFLAEAVS